jgi:hypothetical protein
VGLEYIWATEAEEEWRKEGLIGEHFQSCGGVRSDEFEPSEGEHADRDSSGPSLCRMGRVEDQGKRHLKGVDPEYPGFK